MAKKRRQSAPASVSEGAMPYTEAAAIITREVMEDRTIAEAVISGICKKYPGIDRWFLSDGAAGDAVRELARRHCPIEFWEARTWLNSLKDLPLSVMDELLISLIPPVEDEALRHQQAIVLDRSGEVCRFSVLVRSEVVIRHGDVSLDHFYADRIVDLLFWQIYQESSDDRRGVHYIDPLWVNMHGNKYNDNGLYCTRPCGQDLRPLDADLSDVDLDRYEVKRLSLYLLVSKRWRVE